MTSSRRQKFSVGGFYTTLEGGGPGELVDVYKNPSISELKKELGFEKGRSLRAIAVGDDLLCWDAYSSVTHSHVKQALNLRQGPLLLLELVPNNAASENMADDFLRAETRQSLPKPTGLRINVFSLIHWPPINWETHPYFAGRSRLLAAWPLRVDDARNSAYWSGFPPVSWDVAKKYATRSEANPGMGRSDLLHQLSNESVAGRKTADNPAADAKALNNLAKRDRLAALRHANATPEQLIGWLVGSSTQFTMEEKLQALKSNPVLALMYLESPASDDPLLTEIFKQEYILLFTKMKQRLSKMDKSSFLLFCLRCVESVLPLIADKRESLPAHAINEAYRWIEGEASEADVMSAVRGCNSAAFRFESNRELVAESVAKAAAAAAALVQGREYRPTDTMGLVLLATADSVASERSWPWYQAKVQKLQWMLHISEPLTQSVGKKMGKKKDPLVIQSIMVEKRYAPNVSKAKIWVKKMGGKVSDIDETENFWRFRQHDPSLFVKGSFRTHHTTHGVRTLVAKPSLKFRALFLLGEEE